MQIKVMFRAECLAATLGNGEDYFVENISVPTLILSISGTDEEIPKILAETDNPNIIHTEFFQFDDIDTPDMVHGLTPMSEEDAKRLVDVYEQYKDRVEQIIVHCDAGYSRSPAVAAALCKAIGMSDAEYFGCGDYCPNRHVYRTVMNELASRGYFD